MDLEKYGHKTLEKIPNMFDDMSFDILEETRGELIEMFRGENVDGGWSNASLDNVCYARKCSRGIISNYSLSSKISSTDTISIKNDSKRARHSLMAKISPYAWPSFNFLPDKVMRISSTQVKCFHAFRMATPHGVSKYHDKR